MAKPKPKTLAETDSLEVIETKIWVVAYQGRPVAVIDKTYGRQSYPRACWSRSPFAKQRAEKLNTIFSTTDFAAMELR